MRLLAALLISAPLSCVASLGVLARLGLLTSLGFMTPLDRTHAAEPDFVVPALTGPVVDQAGLLQPRAVEVIGEYLRRLRESGGTQITVVTVPDLGPLSIEEASIKVADNWKLGSKAQDDGVLLLVAQKQRRVRIEVGQGREGVLPDVTASRIVREIIVPRMKAGSTDGALAEGVQAIVSYTDPEFYKSQPFGGHRHPHREKPHVQLFLVLLWLVLLILLFGRNRFFGAGMATGGLMRGPFGGWGGSDGRGGGGSFGGGWSSGGSDDDWSGGGGGFSGGGASGEW